MNKKIIFFIVICILVLGFSGFYFFRKNRKSPNFDDFALCLTQSGAVMYGLETCPHCLAQKELFGPSFQFVKYIDCRNDYERCLQEKINRVPVWVFKDGTRLFGKQSLEKLAQVTKCSLPQK